MIGIDPPHSASLMPGDRGPRVVVIGDRTAASPCDTYRTGMYVEPLARLGIEVVYANAPIRLDRPLGAAGIEQLIAEGADRLHAAVADADVVVFRRAYVTHWTCLECELMTLDPATAVAHNRSTRHAVQIGGDAAVRPFFERLATDPTVAGRLAIVYESDDDLLEVGAENAHHRIYRAEAGLVTAMMRRADVVTTSSPVLADRLRRVSANVTVVRNAVDPAWYAHSEAIAGATPGGIVYYGSLARMRDYAIAAAGVDAAAADSGLRRHWVGAPDAPGQVAHVRGHFDQIHPYVADAAGFAGYLGSLAPAIGVAPLLDSRFARAKSELHWLEYSMAGAVTVASRLPGGGPYAPIRDGVDGFLVETRADWRRVLARVAGSVDLRAEIAGHARERVLAEATVQVRAREWAACYRAAAGAAGRGIIDARDIRPRPPTTSPDRPAARRHEPARVDKPSTSVRRAPEPDQILKAYIAAQAFAGRRPLRLRLGVDGSTAAWGSSAEAGWVTIDSGGRPDLRHDVGFGLPFPDGAVDAIEALGVLDGVGGLAPLLVAEAARVLRPGGAFRLVTPDRDVARARIARLAAQGVVPAGRAGILPGYAAGALEDLLRDGGFTNLSISQSGGEDLVAVATRG